MTAPVARDDLRAAGAPADMPDRARRGAPIVRSVRAAFAFFTRLPVGGFPYDERELAWAAAHAPLVGAAIGAVLGVLGAILLPLGALPAGTLVVGVSMLFTGALHEDGLADTSDALGGGHDRTRVLAILKDSRIGAFGAAALAVSILARAALIGQLAEDCVWAVPLTWCAARLAPVWLMVLLPYVTPSHSAKNERIVRTGWQQAFVATGWFLAAAGYGVGQGWVSWSRAGVALVALGLITAVSGWRYHRRLGGVTGDFLGATEQLGEISVLAVLAWRG